MVSTTTRLLKRGKCSWTETLTLARMQEIKEKEVNYVGNGDANSHVCKVCFESPTAALLLSFHHFSLGRLGGRGAAVDCLDHLRLMQKSDAKKHVSLRRMLLEAQVETHERQLVVAFVGMSYVLGCRLEDD
ncbi:hypothetical protein Tco_0649168 [Tanacetum coccineum]